MNDDEFEAFGPIQNNSKRIYPFPTGLASRKRAIDKDKGLFSLGTSFFERRPSNESKPPSKFSWREGDVIVQPEDQGDVPACVSFSACAVADAKMKIANLQRPDLSPFYLHFCILELGPQSVTNEVWFARKVLEKGLPFVSAADSLGAGGKCSFTPKPELINAKKFFQFKSNLEVKRELSLNGPVVMHIELFNSFHNGYKSGIYRTPAAEESIGSHAVCILGFDDDQDGGCWIGKNSYGPNWGNDGGFFRLAYGACRSLTTYFPTYSFDL